VRLPKSSDGQRLVCAVPTSILFEQRLALSPSLRANGSRECAPDDRLREAIHFAAQRKSGLLRRFRLRSLSYSGQVAPRNDVDRVLHTTLFSRREASEVCIYLSPKRGRGECRVPAAPAASCALRVVKSTRVNEYTGIARHSRTQWF
jgi:hypothetical protein